ncbi:hypothetical protein OROHE_001179 [Orobanche hederae]
MSSGQFNRRKGERLSPAAILLDEEEVVLVVVLLILLILRVLILFQVRILEIMFPTI